MVQIQRVKLPDGTECVALTDGKRSLLFERDRESGDYKLVLVTEPVFGSWGKEDLELRRRLQSEEA